MTSSALGAEQAAAKRPIKATVKIDFFEKYWLISTPNWNTPQKQRQILCFGIGKWNSKF
jgi:uncharacterized membrane protein